MLLSSGHYCMSVIQKLTPGIHHRRCTRSCFQCPLCVGPLAVQSLEPAPESSHLTADNAAPSTPGPWVLCCSYCNWSSSEVGIKFDKPQGIFAQLAKIRNASAHTDFSSATALDSPVAKREADADSESSRERFAAMRSFYQSQLANANAGPSGLSGALGDYGFSSPNALSRIMTLYSGHGITSLKTKNKPTTIREADAAGEGFHLSELDESSAISTLRQAGYDGTVTRPQAEAQEDEGPRFAQDLWPIPHLLRSKRAKRCPVCRHILSKPEAKVNNTRWRIRLVAGNYIPSITTAPLIPPGTPGLPTPASTLLTPLKPTQFLLTFKNHMFEEIKVSLATPATTPGRFASRVTVLCPQFTIDANSDDYDLNEVLKDDHRRRDRADSVSSQKEADTGKIWERGRNWVSIVVEVIPAPLRIEAKPTILRKEGEEEDLSPLREDEDILEIPMFVRLEWEGEASQEVGSTAVGSKDKDKDVKEKRELAYWCVLGIGRISQE
jgi:dynactin 4